MTRKLLLICVLFISQPAFAQQGCGNVGCGANDECNYFEGPYCAGYGCPLGERCWTRIGRCAVSDKVCTIRACIPSASCPPNPYAVFGQPRKPCQMGFVKVRPVFTLAKTAR